MNDLRFIDEARFSPSLTVVEPDVGRYTGIVDQHGDRIFVTRQPIGFATSHRTGYTVVQGAWDVETGP